MKPRLLKIAAAAATAALAATALVSCQAADGGGGGDEPQTLDFIFPNFGGGSEDEANRTAELFEEAHPGVEVTPVPVAADTWGTYFSNVATYLAGGEKPDVIHVPTEGVQFLSENGLAKPIDPLLEEDPEMEGILDNIASGVLDGVRASNGDLFFIPQGWNNMVIFYNTKMFADAGLEAPNPDWTWDDFRATAAQLSGGGKYGYAWAPGLFTSIVPWLATSGGSLLEDGCTPTAESPEMLEVVTYLKGLIDDGIAPQPSAAGDLFTQFTSGNIAMFGAGYWPNSTFAGQGFTDYDVTLFPHGSTYNTVLGGDGYAIMETTDSPDLAWEFQKFSVSEEVQAAKYSEGTNTGMPALRSVAEEIANVIDVPANVGLYYESVDEMPVYHPFPAPPRYSEFEDAVIRHLQLVWAGEVSVEEGLANMQAELVAC